MNIERRTLNVELPTTSHEPRASRDAFSLTEVLLAVGTLAVGMLFIACVFPVSIHFTTVTSERTIAVAAADEAFAKIKLIGVLPFTDPNWNVPGQYQYPFESVATTQPPAAYFAYPSTPSANPYEKQYWWSAICRRVGSNDVQVTVFVCRKVGITTKFWKRNIMPPYNITPDNRPACVFVNINPGGNPDELQITPNLSHFVNDGCTIVDDVSGRIYRVLERYTALPSVVRLDKPWSGTVAPNQRIWIVPSPASTPVPATAGRYPCIAVYQKVMRF